jgi:putative hydrolase of the HAD superfamily
MQAANRSGPRTLLVDALGTIVALAPPAPALCRELADRFGIEVSEAQAAEALAAEIAYYRAHLDDGRDGPSLTALRRRCAEVLRGALPTSEPLARLQNASLTEALLASLRFSAFPDARGALAAARERAERVIVVSNWDVSLGEVLARIGLAPLLDGIVTSAEAGARKPSPSIFRQALALAGTSAGCAIHVGDSLEEDVAGARAVGIAPVLVRRDGEPGPPGVRTIASLTELADGVADPTDPNLC